MDEIEAAFFYGDFSSLHEVMREMLSENVGAINTPAISESKI